jgi:two-component sensor histidine kinase
VNELVTNSYKHAFQAKNTGKIEIELSEKDNLVELIVQDNGPGFDSSLIKKSSVGLEILDALIEQINATLIYSNLHGSSYKITFSKSL